MAEEFISGEIVNLDPNNVDFDKFELEGLYADKELQGKKVDLFSEEPEEEKEVEVEERVEEKPIKKSTETLKKAEDIWEAPDEEVEESPDSIADFAQLFYDKAGFGKFDVSELEEDSLDGFLAHIQKIVEQDSKPSYSNEFVEELDNFVKKGGNPKQYFDMYYGESAELNIDNVEVQRDIVTRHLKETTKWPDSKIEKHVARLELDEELEGEAKEAYASIQEQNKTKRAEMIKQQEEFIKQQEVERQESIKYLDTLITKGSSEELGFELTKKEREEFRRFVFEADRESGLTGYQKYLATQQNAEIRLALAAFKGLTDQKSVAKLAEKSSSKTMIEKLNKMASGSSGANTKGTNRSTGKNKDNPYSVFD